MTGVVFFGAVLLAGELGREDMPNDFADKDAHLKMPAVSVPEIAGASTNSADRLRPIEGAPLGFQVDDAGPADGIISRPLYEVHHQRYSVYWRILRADAPGTETGGMAAAPVVVETR